ncbi:MAG: double-strand break repair helicase AddA [Xanthobacteraceae bacterium]
MTHAQKIIPEAVTAVQAAVADPAVSAFVSANAGSGKTHVLAQRVIRLLLDGVNPAKILCLTFTKAAAANMANRVFGQLGAWISLDDAALDEKLRGIGVKAIDAEKRARARRLFAAALDVPGGLKVETIHAFCTRLLQRFPVEAKTPAHFSVLDDRGSADLLSRATLAVMLDAAARPDDALGHALTAALSAAADSRLRDLLREAVSRRDQLARWIDEAGSLETAIAQLSSTLGIGPDETRAGIEKDIIDGPYFPSSEWPRVAALCRASSAKDQDQCIRLTLAANAIGSEQIEAYRDVFLKGDGEARKSVITKALAKQHRDLAALLDREKERAAALFKRRSAAICRDRTAALLTLAQAVIARYTAEKNRRGQLDYDDLIDRTLAMLDAVESAWVHYKLDRGIDHLLIDEAQDTSPKQWEIVKRLAAEFTAGIGARAVRRSIFAVGDEKQSIFSFQGAAPKEFARMRHFFETRHRASGLAFVFRDFQFSFRSGANVLGAVDAVFAAQDIFASVTSDDAGVPPHLALPEAAPGVVEVWPLIEPDEARDIEGWDAPFDTVPETSPQVQLAQKVAQTIRGAIDRADWIASENRALRAGDVLVLVRQRGPLFEQIIRALKDTGVAVAGADRLTLTEHIAIIDLMALADALLLPDDDLALAIALKSPLFGWDDEALLALAYDRKRSLRAELAARADEQPLFAAALARLERCSTAARSGGPFAFFSWLLGAEGARARILVRLGADAEDALDEFLALALDYEGRETPTLQGFLAWLRAAETEIKRDMEIARDEVRVMTVHGAKGLEAPLVILADTTQPPAGPRPPQLLPLPLGDASGSNPVSGLVWAGRKEGDGPALANARDAARREAVDEYRRLLYVAMTRAAEHLIVCGCRGRKTPPEGCWHDLITNGLAGTEGVITQTIEGQSGPVHFYRKAAATPSPSPPASESKAPPPETEPGWLRQPLPMGASVAPALLSPSRALDPEPSAHPPRSANREAAIARGLVIHRLLQSLPEIPPRQRAAAAQDFLARHTPGLDAESRSDIVTETLAVLNDLRFAELFVPGSFAEAPIVGRIERPEAPPIAVSGQVDRLAVTPASVLIADYKTNRPAPQRLDQVPRRYVAQLALYRAVLTKLYPDRLVRAALVFTDGPHLIEVPEAALAEAFLQVTST